MDAKSRREYNRCYYAQHRDDLLMGAKVRRLRRKVEQGAITERKDKRKGKGKVRRKGVAEPQRELPPGVIPRPKGGYYRISSGDGWALLEAWREDSSKILRMDFLGSQPHGMLTVYDAAGEVILRSAFDDGYVINIRCRRMANKRYKPYSRRYLLPRKKEGIRNELK